MLLNTISPVSLFFTRNNFKFSSREKKFFFFFSGHIQNIPRNVDFEFQFAFLRDGQKYFRFFLSATLLLHGELSLFLEGSFPHLILITVVISSSIRRSPGAS